MFVFLVFFDGSCGGSSALRFNELAGLDIFLMRTAREAAPKIEGNRASASVAATIANRLLYAASEEIPKATGESANRRRVGQFPNGRVEVSKFSRTVSAPGDYR